MRLQKILLLLVGSFLLIGAATYIFSGKLAEAPADMANIIDENQMSDSMEDSLNESRPLMGSATFKNLQTFDQDLVCKLTSVSNINGAFTGKVYLSGANVRGDFDIQEAGQLFASSMIMDGDEMYFWTDTPIGKMSFKTRTTNVDDSSPTTNNSPIAMEEEVNYDCQSWTRDEAMFVPPEGLEFTEI